MQDEHKLMLSSVSLAIHSRSFSNYYGSQYNLALLPFPTLWCLVGLQVLFPAFCHRDFFFAGSLALERLASLLFRSYIWMAPSIVAYLLRLGCILATST